MILIYKDNRDRWHLVKALGKAGIATIAITGHCGEDEGSDGVRQVPDKFMSRLCKDCQGAVEEL